VGACLLLILFETLEDVLRAGERRNQAMEFEANM
jgi:hypothetical protein